MDVFSTQIDIIKTFSGKRILVIGDLILDIYLKGSSTRLCPEAPVPVMDVREKQMFLGGAANTVCNLRALGASVNFCTVAGSDAAGDEAVRLLADLGVDPTTVIRHRMRKTITKSRVIAGSQLITRIDEGTEAPIDAHTSRKLVHSVERAIKGCDALVVSDYDKGVITAPVLAELKALAHKNALFTAVDSKRLLFFSSLQPSYAKPNYREAMHLLGTPVQPSGKVEQIRNEAARLHQKINAPLITVTLDGDGSVVIENGRPTYVCHAPFIASPQVAGAGDTYLSAFVLSFINSHRAAISAEIATAAAAIAVRKESTASCWQAELKNYFNLHSKYIGAVADLEETCAAYRADGKRIVFTNGCFDILHSGHVAYLRRAKKLGNVLIIGLNTDESIKRIKGKDRPINGLEDRLQVLAGLSSVDHIIPFGSEHDDTPVALIRAVRPHVFAKGGDYTKEKLPEAATVEACGGEIVFLDHVPDHSTTRIINRISRMGHRAQEEILRS
ncbi:MAG TPA: D-glycero-beta-D-manno-heptose 1-phosphate adenylyltransferase [Chryseosolibacter sp.]